MSCTSSVVCGNTTASGGWLAIQVVVWPCCSRTACEVTSRLPKRAASAAITASAALRSCRRPLALPRLGQNHRAFLALSIKRGGLRRRGQGSRASQRGSSAARNLHAPRPRACYGCRRHARPPCSTAVPRTRLLRAVRVSVMRVEPAWIDYNGHLNMAYYNVLFDRAVDEVYELLGLGLELRQDHQAFDLHRRGPCALSARAIGRCAGARHLPAARLRSISACTISSSCCHAEEGWLSATSENMALNVNMMAKKVAAFPDDVDGTARSA